MNTKQELLDQFQREFDRKRKIWLRNKLIVVSIFISSIVITYYSAKAMMLANGEIFLFLGFFHFLAAIMTGLVLINGVITDNLNITSKVKEDSDTLEKKIKLSKELLEIQTSIMNEKADCYTENNVKFWMQLARHYSTDDFCVIMDKMKVEIECLEKEIAFLPIKLEVYNQIKERNFWQYLWSMKWTKK